MKTLEKNKSKQLKESFIGRGMSVMKRHTTEEDSFFKGVLASLALHIVCALLLLLLIFILKFFNIKLALFPEQKPPMQDIEYILNSKSMPKPKQKPQPKKIQSKIESKQNMAAPKKTSQPKSTTVTKKSSANQNPAKNNGAKTKNNPTGKQIKSNYIPDFSSSMPKLGSISSGLGKSTTKTHSTGVETSNASIKDADNTSTSNGNSSTHGGFDKKTTKKMITTYDISPYVNELKRNIKWNWKVSKGNENKRVELFLRIAKDGKVIILNVKKTSEIGEVDNAALNAVKKCFPLNPLPSKYSRSYLDIVFVFDSNSLSSKY